LLIVNFDEQLTILFNKRTKEEEKEKIGFLKKIFVAKHSKKATPTP
jgi:hypothetical protein